MNEQFNSTVEIPVTRATYYPPEEEVRERVIGVVKLGVTRLGVDHDVEVHGRVTLSAGAGRDDAYGYEFDLEAPAARLLAEQLLAAAAATEDLG
ncbi:MAG TPA: hypothetical protein VIK38_02525 [Coriobacteriia bacterium]|jgi:hypothetical protein